MKEIIDFLSGIFESDLTVEDIEKEVQDVLQWDSFHIMNFLMEMEEQFQIKISIEEISEIYCVRDLLRMVKK